MNYIYFFRISDACPEQYYAVDDRGKVVGYVRIRWGHIDVFSQDESEILIYSSDLKNKLAGSMSRREKKKHLNKAQKAIKSYLANTPIPDNFKKICVHDDIFGEMTVDLIYSLNIFKV